MSDTKTQIRLRPIIRVFVSSTFSDMKHERNALAAEVFPKLEELCQKNGFQFQAIDLRWGVSTEAGLDHRTMRICFDELRRAQEISPEPNFLVLLGDRYGWRPLPEAISQGEFEKLATAARTGGENQAPLPGAHGKPALQVLEEWYRCDENVLLPNPPATDPDRAPLNYLLQPRTQHLGDGRDYKRRKNDPTKDTQDWLEVQGVLWRLINAAFPAESLGGRFDIDWPQHVADVNDPRHPKRAVPQIVRFQGSATEQEIWCGALSAANAERHIIACFRQIANRDEFSAADAKDFFDLIDGKFDAASAKRQSNLKAAIQQRLGDNKHLPIPFNRLKCENSKVFVDAAEADTKAFCNAVFERFRPIIERQIEEYWDNSAKDSPARVTRELKIEQDEHGRFGRERGGKESFVGRDTELDAIRNYLSGDSKWPLAVHGSSGCGKTALMWRAFEEAPETQKPIIRLIGTTPHSSDLRGLLTNLCQELRQRNPRADALPTDIKELRDELSQHLQAATPEKPLILFLDALDQLGDADNGRLLNWLPPGSLPAHVKLVVSCLSDRATGDSAGQPYAELKRRQIPAENFINLDALSEAESRLLLFDRWLPKEGRKISRDQRARIEQRLASPACRQPIFLKLLFEEVQLWHSYDRETVLGESVTGILRQLFDRLSLETNHGPLLVNRVLGYLSASRHGLAENEILEILFADPDYRAKLNEATEQTRHELPPNAKRIPIALWSRLRFDLAPYFTERAAPGANVLTFYHRQVAEWVQERYATSSEQTWQPHRRLADYFCNQADPEKNQRWKGNSTRPFLELPFHLARSDADELAKILFDFNWLQAKTDKRLLLELIGDFDENLRALPAKHPQRTALGLLQEGLRLSAHFTFQDETQLASQLIGRISLLTEAPLKKLVRDAASWRGTTWLLPQTYHLHPPGTALLRTFRGHTHVIDALALTSDGRRVVSASRDGLLKLWDLESGRCLRTFEGHRHWVRTVAISPDSTLAVSASMDGIKIWDIESGLCLRTLQRQGVDVESITFVPNGRQVVSGERNGISVWDLASAQCVRTMEGHSDSVESLAVIPGKPILISGSRDETVKMWDIQSGRCLRTIESELGSVHSVAVTSDGRRVLLAGGCLKERDLQTGEQLRTFEGHEQFVSAVSISSDRRLAASASWDKTIKVWELETAKCLRTLHGHSADVHSVAITPDSKRAVSGSSDSTLKLWDLENGTDLPPHVGHGGAVDCLAVAPDGRFVISGSYDETLVIWDAETAEPVRTLCGHESIIRSVIAHPFRPLIISASWDKTIRIWSIDDFKCVQTLKGHTGGVNSIALTPDGRWLVSGGDDTTVMIWDFETGRHLRTLHGHSAGLDVWVTSKLLKTEEDPTRMVGSSSTVRSVAVTSNGEQIVSCTDDGTVNFWDLESGQELRSTQAHFDRATALVVSPNGQYVMSGSGDSSIKVWDSQCKRQLTTLRGHTMMLANLAVSRDGHHLVSAARDQTLRVWSLRTWKCVAVFSCDSAVTGCAIVPNGRKILAGDESGHVHFLRLMLPTD